MIPIGLRSIFADGETILTSNGKTPLRCVKAGCVPLPTGNVVACDPMLYTDGLQLMKAVSPGPHDVILTLARIPSSEDERIGYATLRCSDGQAETWKLAGSYSVDNGVGSFMDEQLVELMNGWDDAKVGALWDTIAAQMQKNYVHTRSWAEIVLKDAPELGLVAFLSGAGDGCYQNYLGLDRKGEVLCITTDFGLLYTQEEIDQMKSAKRGWRQFWK